MTDPELKLRVVGGGGGVVLLALLAFLPSVISSFLSKIKRGRRELVPRAPPLDPPLAHKASSCT